MKKIAVVLSGCGFKDGTEITEAVSLLISLSENKADYTVFAPDESVSATNHVTGADTGKRNILEESARISRGEIVSLKKLNADQFDGLAFPGGFGAALHLCDFAKKGAMAQVHPDVRKVVENFYKEQKPILAICIAPALIACILGKHHVTLTIGNDTETAAEVTKTGARHENCVVTDFVTDRENKIVTTPAYMFDAKPFEVFTGVHAATAEFLGMC